jgi:hypothetical protein
MAKMTMLFPRTIQTHRDYILSIGILHWWSICYYQCCYEEEGMPEVPDGINDILYDMVEKWEKANPSKIHPWSTTQVVGYGGIIDDERKSYVRKNYLLIQEGLKRLYA